MGAFPAPNVQVSDDHGETWSEAMEFGLPAGRIYDTKYINDEAWFLLFENDATVDFYGVDASHVYKIVKSTDNGNSFFVSGTLPLDAKGRCYGTMCEIEGGTIVYIYNRDDEHNLDYVLTADGGRTCSAVGTAHFAARLRNPQMVKFGGRYYMHGRSGSSGPDEERGHFILYSSADGLLWDEGRRLATRTAGHGAYSNSVVVQDGMGRKRLRIHASHAYSEHRTNVVAWWLDQTK